MEDVLDVYHRPPDPRPPLVGRDDLSKQLTREARPPLPPRPGHPARCDPEHARNGVANPCLVCAPHLGWRHVAVTERRTGVDWARGIKEAVDAHVPAAERIVPGPDHLNTHGPAAPCRAFPPAEAKRLWDELELHCPPKRGSWLNVAEIELSVPGRQCLNRRRPDRATPTAEVAAGEAARNAERATVSGQRTTDDARIKPKHPHPVRDSAK
jgi:hypothetical protein